MNDRSSRPERALDATAANRPRSPARFALILGMVVVYFVCLRPSLSLALYGDDFAFIWNAVSFIETRPADLLRPSAYMDFFRPAPFIIYYSMYSIFGLDGQAYHLLLLSVHFLNTVLVYRLVLSMSGRSDRAVMFVAVLAALYFMSHFRIHQAVYWFSGIKQMLSAALGLGLLLCVLAALKTGRRRWPLLALLLTLLGLSTVESFTGFAAGAVVISALWPGGVDTRRRLAPAAAAALPLLLYVGWYLLSRATGAEREDYQAFWKPLAAYPADSWIYMFRSVFPWFFEPDGLRKLIAVFHQLALLWAVLTPAALFGAWRLGGRVGLSLAACYLLAVSPYLIAWAPTIEGDRIYYESVSLLCVIAGVGGASLAARPGVLARRGLFVFSAVLAALVLCSFFNYRSVTIPAYGEVDRWNRGVGADLIAHFEKSDYPEPVSLYWIGIPLVINRVVSGPCCYSNAVNLYFDEKKVEKLDLGVVRVPMGKGWVMRPNRFYSPPLPGDVIFYEEELGELRPVSHEEAREILSGITGVAPFR